MSGNQQMKKIFFKDIDFNDRRYKISRNSNDENLRLSIMESGVLDPPVVIDRGGSFRVVFGFNRLDILRDTGAAAVEALVLKDLDTEWYVGRVLLKCARNEMGPIGRIRVHAILKEMGVDDVRLERIAKQCLHLPGEFLVDDRLAAMVGALPESLKDYLDCRDIQFRIIRDLARLPREAHEAMAAWIAHAPLRVNIFRFIVDMLSDILVRDGEIRFVEGIRPDESVDRKQWDQHLLGLIREARYPEYSAMKKKADDVAGYFAARGIRIDYPEYFEGGRIGLTVNLGRRDDPLSVRKKIDNADLSKLKELLDLL